MIHLYTRRNQVQYIYLKETPNFSNVEINTYHKTYEQDPAMLSVDHDIRHRQLLEPLQIAEPIPGTLVNCFPTGSGCLKQRFR